MTKRRRASQQNAGGHSRFQSSTNLASSHPQNHFFNQKLARAKSTRARGAKSAILHLLLYYILHPGKERWKKMSRAPLRDLASSHPPISLPVIHCPPACDFFVDDCAPKIAPPPRKKCMGWKALAPVVTPVSWRRTSLENGSRF